MKRTTVEYFCDRCGAALSSEPAALLWLPQDLGGLKSWYSLNVTVTYDSKDVAADESHLCTECKLYALNEARRILEDKLAYEQQKGEQQ